MYIVVWTHKNPEMKPSAEHYSTLKQAEKARLDMIMQYLPVDMLAESVGDFLRLAKLMFAKADGVLELKRFFSNRGIETGNWNVVLAEIPGLDVDDDGL